MNIAKIAATLAVAAGLGAAGFAFSQPAQAQGPMPPAPPAARPHPRGERHPEIRLALRNLQRSKENLQRAAHDFGGHREQALDLVQRAIDQCQQALRDDRN